MKGSIALNLMAVGLASAIRTDTSPSNAVLPPYLPSLLSAPGTSNSSATATPTLQARQAIDFDLIDSAPLPTVAPDDTSNYDQSAAISSVSAEVSASPLPQIEEKRALQQRDIIVTTTDGYTANIYVGNAALNAPADCTGADTFMGSKFFSSGPFDTSLCAAACTAQSDYNLEHPPSTGNPTTCQFYNTYAMYKNLVYQGQYCSLYSESWDGSYATNDGQYRGTDHYTISDSYISSNATNTGEVSCPSDISYLATAGSDFCTAYISYVPPTVTSSVTSTPSSSTVMETSTLYVTVTVDETSWITSQVTTTVTSSSMSSSILINRALSTPASISTWSPSRISKACSAVATGTVTSTATQTAATLLTTLVTSISTTASTTVTTTETTTITQTTTVTPSPSSYLRNHLQSTDTTNWTIQISPSGQGIGWDIGPSYSEDGIANGVEFYYPSNPAPASGDLWWYQTWTPVPNQLYEITIDLWFELPAVTGECQFTFGGRSSGKESYMNYVNFPTTSPRVIPSFNNNMYTTPCGNTFSTPPLIPQQTWATATAWLQPSSSSALIEFDLRCVGQGGTYKWSNIQIKPISCS